MRQGVPSRASAASLSGHRTKGQAVYDHLREQILSGAYAPGERLTLAQLSSELGTSMMPVREALTRLEREGLVESAPYRHVRVAPLSLSDVSELFSVRAVLEGHALRLAAAVNGVDLAERLDHINERFRAALARNAFGEMSESNWAFHRSILEHAGNRQLSRLLEDVWAKCLRYRAGFRLIPGRGEAAAGEHASIINAVRSGDSHKMEQAGRLHIEKAGEELMTYLRAAENGEAPIL